MRINTIARLITEDPNVILEMIPLNRGPSANVTLDDVEWGEYGAQIKLVAAYEEEGPSGDGWNEPRDQGGTYIGEIQVKSAILSDEAGGQRPATPEELIALQRYIDEQVDQGEGNWFHDQIMDAIVSNRPGPDDYEPSEDDLERVRHRFRR